MNGIFKISLFLTVCAVLAGLAGCEPKETVNERQERLYSVENMELKKQLEKLREQSEKDLQAKQKELDKCNADKTIIEKELSEETAKALKESLIDMLAEQVEQLTQENAKFRAEIETLNKKLEQQE